MQRPVAAVAGLALLLIAAGISAPSLFSLPPPESDRAAAESPAPALAPQLPAFDAMLARTASLYYSMANENLAGFDCAVHPEWLEVFAIANPHTYIKDNDPRLRLLESVKIGIHVAMKQGSKVEWELPAPPKRALKQEQADLLEAMHRATEQTLMGFLQLWKPFVEGSAIPKTSQSAHIAPKGDGGYEIDSEHSGTSVREQFDSGRMLKEFDIETPASSVDLTPKFTPTARGLLVTGFVAHIRPAGADAGKAQVMRVGLDYADVDGVWIPSRLDMTLVGTGAFDFRLDRCRLVRLEEPASNPK